MSTCETGEPRDCNNPLTVSVGGPVANVGTGLAFTALFPCGVELDSVGVVTTPLRTLGTPWKGTVGDCKCPGQKVLVRASIQARQRIASGIVRNPTYGACTANVMSAEPRLKLMVTSCKQPPVIIDSDSELVVDAGNLEIEVLGPNDWQTMGERNVGEGFAWTDVTLKINACPMDCSGYTPEGFLTEWIPTTPPTFLSLVRPRRARRLQVAGTLLPALTIRWQQTPNVGPPGIGSVTMAAAAQATIDPWGAFPYLSVEGGTPFMALLRWGIR